MTDSNALNSKNDLQLLVKGKKCKLYSESLSGIIENKPDKYDARKYLITALDNDDFDDIIETLNEYIDENELKQLSMTKGTFIDDLMVERYEDILDIAEDLLHTLPNIDLQSNTIEETYKSDRVELWTRPVRDNYPIPPQLEMYFLLKNESEQEIKLPMTKKDFDIILHTVKSIKEHGTQFEILLKVKQSDDNPQFDFLNYDSEYHQLYKFLKNLSADEFWSIYLWKPVTIIDKETSNKAINNQKCDDEEKLEKTNVLQDLLGDYSDVSDDDIGNNSHSNHDRQKDDEKAIVIEESHILTEIDPIITDQVDGNKENTSMDEISIEKLTEVCEVSHTVETEPGEVIESNSMVDYQLNALLTPRGLESKDNSIEIPSKNERKHSFQEFESLGVFNSTIKSSSDREIKNDSLETEKPVEAINASSVVDNQHISQNYDHLTDEEILKQRKRKERLEKLKRSKLLNAFTNQGSTSYDIPSVECQNKTSKPDVIVISPIVVSNAPDDILHIIENDVKNTKTSSNEDFPIHITTNTDTLDLEVTSKSMNSEVPVKKRRKTRFDVE